MICVSLGTEDYRKLSETLKNIEFAEIRIDLCLLNKRQTTQIFSSGKKLIATCRPGPFSETERRLLLKEAVLSGATYVDIEIDSAASFKREIFKVARGRNCRVLMSYHNESCTPELKKLREIAKQCFYEGADLSKIACRCLSVKDMVTLFSLYAEEEGFQGRIIALGMGKNASLTRIAAPFLGAPFTYASLEDFPKTADGQLNFREIQALSSRIKRGER